MSTNHKGTVRVLQGRVCGEDRIVWLNNRVCHRRSRVHTKLQLRLFAIIGGETFENQSTETRSSATTKGVEHEKALQTSTVVGEPANLVHDVVDLLLSNRVVTTSILDG